MIIEENTKTNNNKILLIDFSKDIFKNNIFYEISLHLVCKNYFNIFTIFFNFLSGSKKLKSYLLSVGSCYISNAPIKDEVQSFILQWKEKGGSVYLLSPLKKEDTKVLNITFNKIINFKDDNEENIKNIIKEDSNSKFYSYSKTNIDIERENIEVLSIEHKKIRYLEYFKQLRPKQWTKNLLVFSPILLLQSFNLDIFISCFYAFLIFSYFSSCIYILNDLIDLESDRMNSIKMNRPLASGKVSLVFFLNILPILFLLGIYITFAYQPQQIPLLASYLLISISYSMWLKKKVLIDIFILASLFTIRLLVGAQAALMSISFWILAFSIFIFLALASIKRFSEKSYLNNLKHNNLSGRGYVVEDIQILESIGLISSFSASIVFALYINTTEVSDLVLNIQSLWLICLIILYWLLRLNLIARRADFIGDPLEFSLTDRVSYCCLFLISCLYANGNFNFIPLI